MPCPHGFLENFLKIRRLTRPESEAGVALYIQKNGKIQKSEPLSGPVRAILWDRIYWINQVFC
jgi:hypothetical protein